MNFLQKPRFIVNVTSPEGNFESKELYPTITGFHPHTNMSKAALNQLTISLSPQLAQYGVYVTR